MSTEEAAVMSSGMLIAGVHTVTVPAFLWFHISHYVFIALIDCLSVCIPPVRVG